MIKLPCQDVLPVERLAGSFNNVTNSYKYYWFLAILEQIEKKPDTHFIALEDLSLQMLSLVWYPLDFYKLSFGKQDSFKSIAEETTKGITINNSPTAPDLFQQLKQSFNSFELKRLTNSVQKLVRYVPFRFQRPFVAEELRNLKDSEVNKAIINLAAELFSSPYGKIMYRYVESESLIELHPMWMSYLQRHLHTLRGFVHFDLVRFLQLHNPHVPGLSEKLFRPRSRNLGNATKFWKLYLQNDHTYSCPYSSTEVKPVNFTLDHFVPWSYVAHDSLWNLVPVPQKVNSSKSNALPSLPNYLTELCTRQFNAFKFLLENNIPNANSYLEDYVQLFGQDLSGLCQAGEDIFNNKLCETIRPLIQIAGNLGFQKDWVYKSDNT